MDFFCLSKFPTFKKRAFFFKRTIEGISLSIKEVMLLRKQGNLRRRRRKKKKKTRKQFICSAWRNLNSFMCIRLYTHTHVWGRLLFLNGSTCLRGLSVERGKKPNIVGVCVCCLTLGPFSHFEAFGFFCRNCWESFVRLEEMIL